jgi:hypothetical protein
MLKCEKMADSWKEFEKKIRIIERAFLRARYLNNSYV